MTARLRPIIELGACALESLWPKRRLDAPVVDAYLRLVERRSRYYKEAPSVWACDSAFFEDWEAGGFPATQERVYENIFDCDVLLFPILRPGSAEHWALIVCRPKTRSIRAYDPLLSDRRREMKATYQFLSKVADEQGIAFRERDWNFLATPPRCPLASDGVPSGVYILAYAECITAGIPVGQLNEGDNVWRRRIASEIRRGRIKDEAFDVLEPSWAQENAWRFGKKDEAHGTALMRVKSPEGVFEMEQADDPVSLRTYDVGVRCAPSFEQRSRVVEEVDENRSVSPTLSLMAGSDLGSESSSKYGVEPFVKLKSEVTFVRRVPDDQHPPPQKSLPSEVPPISRNLWRRGKRRRKFYKVRFQRPDGTFYRVKYLKDRYMVP